MRAKSNSFEKKLRAIRPRNALFRPRRLLRRLQLRGKNTEEVFTYIYENNMWGADESVSGGGSTLAATESIRRELPAILSSLGVRSLFDAPCGDFNWMSQVDLPLDLYIGGDIVSDLVERLGQQFGTEVRRFITVDITRDPLPETDAFLCRDCLLHLPNSAIIATLDNARNSSMRYLLASTYTDCEVNEDIRMGLSRAINLCRAPFNLPKPLHIISDASPTHPAKCLAVWSLEDMRG